ncbi:hypothetical protein DU002_03910 [Corallincola holothuriorum]|uniref:DUF7674 domain-containing protein n=1 Tax=Corallincola holothuriorum TaxID=2282215 RepID=A0A368NP34_9GAMM|nr:hypothetical protein [Corallincola holothuriorum]RCU51625.1 hypothetical protein DU002_03910 [Corallincola holothuriorum]
MPVIELYNEFRNRFPEITTKADRVHIKYWGDLNPEFAYSWFESLANTINNEMAKCISASKYAGVFRYICVQWKTGDEEIKNCIDVAFTENLFYQIKPEKIEPYWKILPREIKSLYVNFHGHHPL